MVDRRHLSRVLCVVVAFAAIGCRPTAKREIPLFDDEHAPSVLVEQRLLSNPQSILCNRLLRGWQFLKRSDRPRFHSIGDESLIELVHLTRRDRRLVLTLADPVPSSTVAVFHRGRMLGRHPLERRTEIRLPDDLPTGRIVFTFALSHSETEIETIEVTPCHPEGEVELVTGRVVQRGWSSLELVRRVPAGARLRTAFEPPRRVEPGQRFTLTVERSGSPPETIFVWDANDQRAGDAIAIDEGLASEAGPVLVRFWAEGAGDAGAWLDPTLVVQDSEPTPSGLPPALDGPRIVIIYVMDALRADHVGIIGPTGPLTPVVDRLAAEGARFDNHFAVAPNTPPSTRALFTGLVMLDDRRLPDPGPARLAETFRAAGYRTALVTGNPHLGPKLDLAPGFDTVELLRVAEDHHPKRPATINRSAEIVHEAMIARLDELLPGDRAFFYVHTMNPHNPYTPPPEIEARLVPPEPSAIDGRTRTLVAIRDRDVEVSADDIRRIRQLYAAGVAYNDRELGRLVAELGRRFAPGEVLLVLTSDHGEELFEHGGVLHGYTLYDEMLHIPLVFHWPGRVPASRITAPTTTLDLHATLVELAAGRHDGPNGSSLWTVMTDSAVGNERQPIVFAAAPGLGEAVMARSTRWKLVFAPRDGLRRGQGHGRGRTHDLEYVFDLASDSDEQRNLAGIDDLEVAWLRSRLAGWQETQRTLQPPAGDRVMDETTREQLEALGYVVD